MGVVLSVIVATFALAVSAILSYMAQNEPQHCKKYSRYNMILTAAAAVLSILLIIFLL